MSKGSRAATESAVARLCEWRGVNCDIYSVVWLMSENKVRKMTDTDSRNRWRHHYDWGNQMDDKMKEMPEGLAFSMAMNQRAMDNFARMTEEQKSKVVESARQVTTKQGMERLVDSIAENCFRG